MSAFISNSSDDLHLKRLIPRASGVSNGPSQKRSSSERASETHAKNQLETDPPWRASEKEKSAGSEEDLDTAYIAKAPRKYLIDILA